MPPAHPLNPALKAWADDIEKQTGGTVKSTLFLSEQLGKAFDHYDIARDGIADFTYANPGYQPGSFLIIAAGELPFLFANAKAGSAAVDAWYRKHAAREMKDIHYCFGFEIDPGALHGKRKMRPGRPRSAPSSTLIVSVSGPRRSPHPGRISSMRASPGSPPRRDTKSTS